MSKETNPRTARIRRHRRVRKKVAGTMARPRLAVFRSLKHIYAQLINDDHGHTFAAASTLESKIRQQQDGLSKTDQARLVGELLAKRALEHGVKRVVFDRGGFRYHGRLKALADAARAAGLEF
ncbi:MAG: 50S ribosomal protein L18 [Chloroflexi bacterium]|nr:50S ribosomal protein L18 [Chloroflexota bacterium]MCL5074955.1 50S ribosomal protein L18 [Chloroflexota bacterium]